MPIGFWLDGVTFYVEGYEAGDFPTRDVLLNREVKEVVGRLADVFGEKK